MLEFLWGVGGGFLAPTFNPEGELVTLRFPGGRGGGGGVGPVTGAGGGGGGGGGGAGKPLLSGGGGNSWDGGIPPGCHLGLVFTAGGEMGALGGSVWLVSWEEPPGNWLASCFTKDVAGGGAVERFAGLDRLCCLGRVGGG